MFKTATYKQKRDEYKALLEALEQALTEHYTAKEQAKECADQSKSKMEAIMESTGSPNQETIEKLEELFDEAENVLNKISARNDSLQDGAAKAQKKYAEYNELYLAEKAREETYLAEQRRLSAENLKRAQERTLNPDFSAPTSSGESITDYNNRILNPKW